MPIPTHKQKKLGHTGLRGRCVAGCGRFAPSGLPARAGLPGAVHRPDRRVAGGSGRPRRPEALRGGQRHEPRAGGNARGPGAGRHGSGVRLGRPRLRAAWAIPSAVNADLGFFWEGFVSHGQGLIDPSFGGGT
jgi:hypothetical protein